MCCVYFAFLALAPVIFIALAFPPARTRLIRALETYSYAGTEKSQVTTKLARVLRRRSNRFS